MPVCSRSLGKLPSPCFVKTILCGALISAVSLLADPVNSSRATVKKIDQSDLLWWLPIDTESVVAARGPFPFPAGSSTPSEKEDEKWFTVKATLPQIQSAFEELPLEIVDDAN